MRAYPLLRAFLFVWPWLMFSGAAAFSCSRLVDSESTADLGAREMKEAGVEGLVIVPDTWFFPGKTAMALTAHFPPTIPLACVGGNNAPKPGVVGIDALVGAYAQTGRLCPMARSACPGRFTAIRTMWELGVRLGRTGTRESFQPGIRKHLRHSRCLQLRFLTVPLAQV